VAVQRADAFVAWLPNLATRIVDLGSGGGLPALVIAWRRPDATVTMIERRATRADLLRRAIASLELGTRCEVVVDDARRVASLRPAIADVVTARSFAAPSATAAIGAALVRRDGLLLVAEPPTTDLARWPSSLLLQHELVDLGCVAGVRAFRRADVPRETTEP
jgi:16S rRNA (guanine527-N7)-methyltransferase